MTDCCAPRLRKWRLTGQHRWFILRQNNTAICQGWMTMKPPGEPGETADPALRSTVVKSVALVAGKVHLRSYWVMNENCPSCGLDFDRGDPGYFTGAMYVSYALAIPLIALLTLIEYLIVRSWSLFRLVLLASIICLPLTPWIWQYSRVIWIYFDRYFDPEDDHGDSADSPVDDRKWRACWNMMARRCCSARSPKLPATCGIAPDHLETYGRDKAKVRLEALHAAEAERPSGKLILVSAITPTPAGEGKTTTSIGLSQGLHRIGKKSRSPCGSRRWARSSGAKGEPRAEESSRVEPSNTINLQFTGDFHAITAAHNLLAAAIDNRLHFATPDLDPTRVALETRARHERPGAPAYRDRAGRQVAGVPRESGFDITAASEVMAILCLADSPADLRARLDRILWAIPPREKRCGPRRSA